MIKNSRKLKKFYRDREAFERNEHLSFEEAFRINDKLCQEAVSLGIINSENFMDGFETTLRIARAIHCLKPNKK